MNVDTQAPGQGESKYDPPELPGERTSSLTPATKVMNVDPGDNKVDDTQAAGQDTSKKNDPEFPHVDTVCDIYLEGLKSLVTQIRAFVKTSDSLLNSICGVSKHQEDEHHHFQKALDKALDSLTDIAMFFVDSFHDLSKNFCTEMPTFHALQNPNADDSIRGKEKAAKMDFSKHGVVMATCIWVIKGEVKDTEELLRKKISVDHKHMNHQELVEEVRKFAEYIGKALERLIFMDHVFFEVQNEVLKGIFGTNKL